mmetsp:Transcript_36835/g.95054  ORF Transcript_36835/g.95054 Transcript_36835/m.95054 type:complete len:255 (+) Transcript_36835:1065-1829(+)
MVRWSERTRPRCSYLTVQLPSHQDAVFMSACSPLAGEKTDACRTTAAARASAEAVGVAAAATEVVEDADMLAFCSAAALADTSDLPRTPNGCRGLAMGFGGWLARSFSDSWLAGREVSTDALLPRDFVSQTTFVGLSLISAAGSSSFRFCSAAPSSTSFCSACVAFCSAGKWLLRSDEGLTAMNCADARRDVLLDENWDRRCRITSCIAVAGSTAVSVAGSGVLALPSASLLVLWWFGTAVAVRTCRAAAFSGV